MADELHSPSMSAVHINDLVKHAVDVYRDTFDLYLSNFMQSGYLPYTQPPKSQEQQDYLLSQQASQQALQMIGSPDAAEREQGVQLLRDIQEARNGLTENAQEATDEGEQSGAR